MRELVRKFLVSIIAVAFATAAYASNIPLLPGPVEAGNLLSILNNLILQINSGTTGLVGANVVPAGAIATTVEQTLGSVIIPTGQLSLPGQALRARCFGITAANTHAKTVGLYVGSAVVSSATFSTSGYDWDLELVYIPATSPVTANAQYVGHALIGSQNGVSSLLATPTYSPAVVAGNDTTDNLANNSITVKCNALLGSSAVSDVTMQGLVIEQVK